MFRRFFGWVASLFKKKPKNGHLFIATVPGGLPLKIDLQNRGETRSSLQDPAAALELPAGKHTVEIVFPNNERWSREIDVVAGRKHYVNLEYHPKQIILNKPPCPYPVNISAPVSVNDGDLITFTSDVDYSGSGSLNYTWTVSPSEARIVGGAGTATITVDSIGLGSQRVTASLVVDDGSGDAMCRQTAQASTRVDLKRGPPPLVCPNVTVSCPDTTADGQPVTFTATISGASPGITPSYNWTVSSGLIVSGQGTPSITVDTTGLAGQTIRANVDVGGCPASCATSVPGMNKPRRPPGDNGSSESATPSPSPSPGATPTPPPPPGGEKDRITINYPQTVCFRHPERIRVVYDRVKGDFKVETRVENREVRTTISPETRGGLTGTERVAEGIRIARVTAIPTLVGEGFTISALERTIEKSLDDDHVVWDWQVTPKFLYRSHQPIELAFQVNLYDQNNNLIRSKDWVRQDISVDVSICTNGELAAISAFFGTIALALVGFGWKVMAVAPALFVRSIYNISGGQQGAVGDGAQAINVTQQSGKTDSNNKGEKTDGKSREG